jgi:amphi-Trp domain-containing protein
MVIIMEIPKERPSNIKKEVKGEFSREFYMNRTELSSFLRNLADQVEAKGNIRITSEDWVMPFSPMDMVKVDIDLDESELEIEIEFKKSTDALKVEKDKPNNIGY